MFISITCMDRRTVSGLNLASPSLYRHRLLNSEDLSSSLSSGKYCMENGTKSLDFCASVPFCGKGRKQPPCLLHSMSIFRQGFKKGA